MSRPVRGSLPISLLCVVVTACAGSGGTTSSVSVAPGTAPDTTSMSPPIGWANGDGTVLTFTDVTDSAAVSFRSSTPFDLANYTSEMDTAKMRGGAAAGDFDGDGRVDIFVIGGGLRPDALFLNQGDGTFADGAEQSGLAQLHLGSGAAAGDYDGDGDLDLFVTSHGPPGGPEPGHHRLYRNDGGRFTDVAAEAGVAFTSADHADGFGAVFGDYDLDGRLDLFVAGWVDGSRGNRLFRNRGDGTFEDVTDRSGIADDGIRGFSPCLVDMDGDRYPELLLVGDFGTSRYFINRRGTFAAADAREAGTGLEWSGMGTAVGDVDNDGMLDWYATAIFDATNSGRGDGNKLYRNLGDHRYEERAAAAGVDDGGWGWGSVAVDLDHDGWLDLVEVNGWHFPDFPQYTDTPARMWMNRSDGTFAESAGAAGLDHRLMGLSLIDLDYDGDGDRDLAITAANDEFRLYRNDLTGSGGSLTIHLDTSGASGLAPGGIGARVRVTADGQTQLRYAGGCSNYLSTADPSLHFGLGQTQVADHVVVEWADGSRTVLEDVQAGQAITIRP